MPSDAVRAEAVTEAQAAIAACADGRVKEDLSALLGGALLVALPSRAGVVLSSLPLARHQDALRYRASRAGAPEESVAGWVAAWWASAGEPRLGDRLALGLWGGAPGAEERLALTAAPARLAVVTQCVIWGVPSEVDAATAWAMRHGAEELLEGARHALVVSRPWLPGARRAALVAEIQTPGALLSAIAAAADRGATEELRRVWLGRAQGQAAQASRALGAGRVGAWVARAAVGVDEGAAQAALRQAWGAVTHRDAEPEEVLALLPDVLGACARVGITPWREALEAAGTDRKLRRLPTERQRLLAELAGTATWLPAAERPAAIPVLRGLYHRVELPACRALIQAWVAWLGATAQGIPPEAALLDLEGLLAGCPPDGTELAALLRQAAERVAQLDVARALRMARKIADPRCRALWLAGVIDPGE